MAKISEYPLKDTPAHDAWYVLDADSPNLKYRARFGSLNLFASAGKMRRQEQDFLCGTTAPIPTPTPFEVLSFGAGTLLAINGEANHPGILQISCTAGAGTGGMVGSLGATSVSINGNEVFECIVRFDSLVTFRDVIGFTDQLSSALPADGIFFHLVNSATLSGNCAKSGGGSTQTGTTYTVVAATWYRLKIVVNSTATRVDFYVYSMADVLLWTDFVVGANIPVGVGQETAVAIQSSQTAGGARALLDIDWMAFYNEADLVR